MLSVTHLGILALGLEVALDPCLNSPVELCGLGEDGQFVADQRANVELLHDRVHYAKLMIHLKDLRFQQFSKT